jgi:GT2 family glycosyltransferase
MSRATAREGRGGSASPKCSVIIPVFNRSGLTRQCLDILLAEPPTETDRELIVVDDASTDSTAELLAGYGDAVRAVTHEQNTGFATSCNDGAAAARGDYLVLLNNDTLPLKGWLDALVRYADSHPQAAVVGCKLLFPDDTVQHAGVAITEDHNPRHIYAGFPADHPAVNKSRRFPIVTAGCALFRREAFEEASGFDDSYVNGFEDVDLCLRIGELGHEVHYCHEAVLYHLEMATRSHRGHADNHLLYRRRWAHKVQPDAMRYYMEDGLFQIRFAERYPFFVEVAPELALIEEGERQPATDQLLAARSRQVYDLGRENVLLKLQLAEAGITPAEDHWALGLRAEEPTAAYLVSDTPGDPMRYRCDHLAEELEILGATARVSRLDEASLGREGLDSSAVFVLHRVPARGGVEWFLNAARERNKLVIFDTDDLLFEPRAGANVLDLLELPDVERQVLADRIEAHTRAMAMCDAVFVPTEPLAELARELNPHIYVIPNAASKEMVRLADEALDERVDDGDAQKGVTIAYFSGSPTHDRDFLQSADAVLWALDQDASCRLLVVGNLSLEARFDRFQDRITRVPIQPWRRLPRLLRTVDINLAPLEPDNPFTESKSCLKYIEAGLVGVPTISSARSDFRRAIEHGENGLLADSPEEWRDALGQLLDSRQLRTRLGRAAHDDVRARHTTLALAPRVRETMAQLTKGPARDALTVHCLVDPASLGRERASALGRLVKHLRERRHTVRLFASGDPGSGSVVVEDGLQLEALPDTSKAHLADVSIALDPQSASTVARRSDALFKLYLVDGTEEDGHRLSDRELSSLLELPLRPVGLGEQLGRRLSKLRGTEVDCLPLPLDPEQFERLLQAECFGRAASLEHTPS